MGAFQLRSQRKVEVRPLFSEATELGEGATCESEPTGQVPGLFPKIGEILASVSQARLCRFCSSELRLRALPSLLRPVVVICTAG